MGLATRLPKSGSLQISDWREGAVECQFAHTKCNGDGKTCPSEDQLAESRVFQRSCEVVIQKPLKKVHKARESVNVGCCQVYKSVGDTRNLGEIFTAKLESTTSGGSRGAFIRRRTSTM